MPYYEFQWNEENLAKLDINAVSPDDFEEVVCHPVKVEPSRSNGRPIAFGFAADGRLIACVYDPVDEVVVLPITAYYLERQ
jgi:uncharacterized DUF497 family protein